MSNAAYDIARYRLMTGAFNWVTADLGMIAWSGPLQFFKADATIAAVKAHGGVTERGRALTIVNKTVTSDGIGQMSNVVIPVPTAGVSITHLTLIVNNAVPDNAVPLLYIDDVLNLPFLSNGLDMVVRPDWLANRGLWQP